MRAFRTIVIIITFLVWMIGCSKKSEVKYAYIIAEGLWAVQTESDLANSVHDVARKRRFNFGEKIKILGTVKGREPRTEEMVDYFRSEFDNQIYYIRSSQVSERVFVIDRRTVCFQNPDADSPSVSIIPPGIAAVFIEESNGFIKVKVRDFKVDDTNKVEFIGDVWIPKEEYSSDSQVLRESFFYYYLRYYTIVEKDRNQAEFFRQQGLEVSKQSKKETFLTKLFNEI